MSVKNYTIPERYARLRDRQMAPPRRRGGKRSVQPEQSGLRAELEAQLAKKRAQPALSGRVKSPLVLDLEKRLAERVGLPRSVPGGRVDLGNPAQFGDRADDRPEPSMPAGEKMS